MDKFEFRDEIIGKNLISDKELIIGNFLNFLK